MTGFAPTPGMPAAPVGWAGVYGGLLLTRRLSHRKGAGDSEVLARLRRVREGLRSRPEEPIDLETMARTACFSKFHFLRLFRQAYGETPGRFLSQMRLERARVLLETTPKSVTEVCLDVGYESLASFSAAFRRHTGDSPQRYRRRWFALSAGLGAGGGVRRVPGCFVAMYS